MSSYTSDPIHQAGRRLYTFAVRVCSIPSEPQPQLTPSPRYQSMEVSRISSDKKALDASLDAPDESEARIKQLIQELQMDRDGGAPGGRCCSASL